MDPSPDPPRGISVLRRLAAGLTRPGAPLRDPLFFVMSGVLLLKSFAAVLLINNPDHSVLDPGHLHDYEFSVVIFVGFVAIPVSHGFLFHGRARLAYYLALDAALSLLLVADLWYFRACSTFLSFLLYQQTANLSGLRGGILAMARPVDLLFVADLAVLVPVVGLGRGLYRTARRTAVVAAIVPLAAVASLLLEHRRLDADGTNSDVRFVEPCWEARQTISFQSPLGFHVLDFWSVFLRNRTAALSPAERQAIAAWFARKHESLPDNRYKGLLKGRNLIVVQVESLERFVVGHAVQAQEVTPSLNAILPNSLSFDSIYDQAHEGLSSDADLMINTSVYPVRKGSTFFRFPGNGYNSLPTILRAAGYRSAIAMHPDPGVYWNCKNGLTAIGFDPCLDMAAFGSHEILGLGLSDGDFLQQAGTVLLGQPEPFYAFMVTLTSHEPFELPERYRELKLDGPIGESKLGGALQCFRYTDRQIGHLLERLGANGMLDRSVVVVVGDHGSVHRFFEDELPALHLTDPWMLDDRDLVPFIVYAPGLAGEHIAVTGGQIDIMPTLLYLLGIDNDRAGDTAMGRNLLRTGRDFAVLADGTTVGRDAGAPWVTDAVEGLAIADAAIRADYFRLLGYGRR